MSEDKSIKLIRAVKELNIGMNTIVDFLTSKGYKIEKQPMAKLDSDMYSALLKEFAFDKSIKEEAKQISIGKIRKEEPGQFPDKPNEPRRSRDFENEEILIKNTGHFSAPVEKPKPESVKTEDRNDVSLPGVKVVGKIDLNAPVRAEKKEEPVVAKKEIVPEVKEEPKKAEEVKPAAVKAVEPEPVKEVKEEIKQAEPKAVEPPVAETPAGDEPEVDEVIRTKAERLSGPNVIGKIQLPVNAPKRNPVASSSNTSNAADHKRKRKRKDNQGGGGNNQPPQGGNQPPQGTINPNRPDFRNRNPNAPGGNRPDFRNRSSSPGTPKEEPTEKEIQDQIKATLARLSGAGKSGKFAQRAKFRRQKRDDVASSAEELALEQELQSKVLKVTEFVTANELALMMDVSVTQIISTCMSLGMFVSINQRLDAETLAIVADEFGYQVEFVKPQDE